MQVRVSSDDRALCRAAGGYTLMEVLIVVGMLGLLLAIAIPATQRSRRKALEMECMNTQLLIEAAKDQFAMEHRKPDGYTPTWAELYPYLEHGRKPVCPANGHYGIRPIGERCYCTIHDRNRR